jgi:2-aminoadipate transaminase
LRFGVVGRAVMCKQFGRAAHRHKAAFQQIQGGLVLYASVSLRRVWGERAIAMCNALKRELGGVVEFTQPQDALFFLGCLVSAAGTSKDAGEFAGRGFKLHWRRNGELTK